MKLKQTADDFRVDEIWNGRTSVEKDSFKIYLLEKRGIETHALLSYLSKKNRIPVDKFGIAGMKDKHAVTRQFFSIHSEYSIKTLKENNFSIKFAGFAGKEIALGDNDGNRFEIVVRNVLKGELDGILKKAEEVKSFGVPNYFDSQRFGSVIKKDFIAKELMKQNYEGAVRIFLTQFSKFEKSRVKDEKKRLAQNWEHLNTVSLKEKTLQKVVGAYLHKKDWLDAYKAIPANIRQLFISAYQSYLWNECLKELLKEHLERRQLYSIEYNVGTLIFFKNATKEELKKIPETLMTINEDVNLCGNEGNIIKKILEKEDIELREFDIKSKTGNFFKADKRKIIMHPEELVLSPPVVDELNDKGKKNRFKIILSFSLGKGSYATVVTKKIFNS
jgi:tRNA pseudouridine13 synthase